MTVPPRDASIWDTNHRLGFTHWISSGWKPHLRRNQPNCTLIVTYLGGMVGYSLALIWRVVGVAKDILAFGGTCVVSFLTCGFFHRFISLGDRFAVMCGSIAEVFNAVIGILCPPLAYYLDERVLRYEIIARHQLLPDLWELHLMFDEHIPPMFDEQFFINPYDQQFFINPMVDQQFFIPPPMVDRQVLINPMFNEQDLAAAMEASLVSHAADQDNKIAHSDLHKLRYAFRNAQAQIIDYSDLEHQIPKAYSLGMAEVLIDMVLSPRKSLPLHTVLPLMKRDLKGVRTAPLLGKAGNLISILLPNLDKKTLWGYVKISIVDERPPPVPGKYRKEYDKLIVLLNQIGANLTLEGSQICKPLLSDPN